MAQHLVRKGPNALYCKVSIPRPLRRHFLSESGKEKDAIWEPMGQDPVAAKTRCADRVAHWLHVFARLQAGETLEDIKASEDIDRANAELAEAFARERREHIADFSPEQLAAELWKMAFARDHADKRLRELEDRAKATGLTEAEYQEHLRREGIRMMPPVRWVEPATVPAAPVEPPVSETVSEAAEELAKALQRDGLKQMTICEHRQRIAKFIKRCGDLPLAQVTRAMASDFLDWIGEGRSNATRNNYAGSMAQVFTCARKRGRFSGDNPFSDQKIEAESEGLPFDAKELQAIITSLPRDKKPAKHSPETTMPWIVLISAFTGCRLEEIAQLTVADIREQQANGGEITCFGIHDEGDNSLKNKASKRLVPVHSALARAGLFDYLKALPQGGLAFPGLVRRKSKGGKLGVRVGELFRKHLIALGIKRKGKDFRSFRHSVAESLEAAAVSQTDAARVLGHKIDGMSYGVYSSGPGLKRLAAIVEEIKYDGLRV